MNQWGPDCINPGTDCLSSLSNLEVPGRVCDLRSSTGRGRPTVWMFIHAIGAPEQWALETGCLCICLVLRLGVPGQRQHRMVGWRLEVCRIGRFQAGWTGQFQGSWDVHCAVWPADGCLLLCTRAVKTVRVLLDNISTFLGLRRSRSSLCCLVIELSGWFPITSK
jgi:hypothetical protein